MNAEKLSTKYISGLEQEVTQLLKTMRSAKLSHLQIYKDLQGFEKKLAEVRIQRFDTNNRKYPGY